MASTYCYKKGQSFMHNWKLRYIEYDAAERKLTYFTHKGGHVQGEFIVSGIKADHADTPGHASVFEILREDGKTPLVCAGIAKNSKDPAKSFPTAKEIMVRAIEESLKGAALSGDLQAESKIGSRNLQLEEVVQGLGVGGVKIADEAEDVQVLGREFDEAFALREAGDFAGSIRLYEKVLAGYEAQEGCELKVADIYQSLGIIAGQQGDHEKAQLYFQKDLQISVSKLGEGHLRVASCYNNLGAVAEEQGEYEEAKTNCQKALQIYVDELGGDHDDVATWASTYLMANCYFNLGNIMKNQGEFEEAKTNYQKALQIYVDKLGGDHDDVASTYLNLAMTVGEQSDYEEAKAYFKKALTVYVGKLGEDHEKVATCYQGLREAAMEQGEYEEARAHNEKALQIFMSTLGEGNVPVDVADSYLKLGRVSMEQGEYEEARAHNEKALQLYMRTLGENDPTTKGARGNLALCFKSIGEKAAADGDAAAAAQAFDAAIEHGVAGFDGGFRDWISSVRGDLGV